MKKIILKWLDKKINYVSCKTPNENVSVFNKKISNLLFFSRMPINELEASDCYIIKVVDKKIDYKLEHPSHYRYNFDNFNVKRNEYVYDKINMANISNNLSTIDCTQNRAIIIELLNELQHSYKRKNKFIEKLKTVNYKDVFFDANSENVDTFVDSAIENLKENIFDFNDFKENYLNLIREESQDLEEIGIFYPVVFNHDILEEKHYIFEINHLKFQRRTEQIFDKVNKFYMEYGVNCNKLKEVMSLEEYFANPGFQYAKQIAYFDPFKNYEKYKDEYEEIKNTFKKSKLSFEEFIYELYNVLNIAQFGVVKFQHENMLNFLQTKRSNGRTYSLRELAEIKKSQLEKGELGVEGVDYQAYNAILYCLVKQDSDFKFTKNTKVDDLNGVDFWPIEMKGWCQFIIDDINMTTNKHHNSSLKYIYNHYNTSLLKIANKYNLKKNHQKVLSSMILDLIFFYDNHEKLSQPYNKKIANYATKHVHKKYDDLINFNKMNKFIQEYQDEFEQYRAFEFENQNGTQKLIWLYGDF